MTLALLLLAACGADPFAFEPTLSADAAVLPCDGETPATLSLDARIQEPEMRFGMYADWYLEAELLEVDGGSMDTLAGFLPEPASEQLSVSWPTVRADFEVVCMPALTEEGACVMAGGLADSVRTELDEHALEVALRLEDPEGKEAPFRTRSRQSVAVTCDPHLVCMEAHEQDWYPDLDGDGYGDAGGVVRGCEAPGSGYVTAEGDCDDEDAARHPGATERPEDGVDQDCDGVDSPGRGL